MFLNDPQASRKKEHILEIAAHSSDPSSSNFCGPSDANISPAQKLDASGEQQLIIQDCTIYHASHGNQSNSKSLLDNSMGSSCLEYSPGAFPLSSASSEFPKAQEIPISCIQNDCSFKSLQDRECLSWTYSRLELPCIDQSCFSSSPSLLPLEPSIVFSDLTDELSVYGFPDPRTVTPAPFREDQPFNSPETDTYSRCTQTLFPGSNCIKTCGGFDHNTRLSSHQNSELEQGYRKFFSMPFSDCFHAEN